MQEPKGRVESALLFSMLKLSYYGVRVLTWIYMSRKLWSTHIHYKSLWFSSQKYKRKFINISWTKPLSKPSSSLYLCIYDSIPRGYSIILSTLSSFIKDWCIRPTVCDRHHRHISTIKCLANLISKKLLVLLSFASLLHCRSFRHTGHSIQL